MKISIRNHSYGFVCDDIMTKKFRNFCKAEKHNGVCTACGLDILYRNSTSSKLNDCSFVFKSGMVLFLYNEQGI